MLDTRPDISSLSDTLCIPPACDAGGVPAQPTSGTGDPTKPDPGDGIVVAGGGDVAMSGSGGSQPIPVAGTGVGGMSMPTAGTGGSAPPPVVLKEDGEACTQDIQCKSSHCDGVCCSGGDCCKTEADCQPTTVDGTDLVCNVPSTCQGSGGELKCTADFRCVAMGGADNDSGCTAQTVANECGAFLPVYCNGQVEQSAPACATTCRSDADCDSNAHCATGLLRTCQVDTPNGGACVGDGDCASNHCAGGICCDSGDCCILAAFCPSSYSTAASCNSATCQGTGEMAACMNFQCTSITIQDDSACTAGTVANDCGNFADVTCSGGASQPMAPPCQTRCNNDSQCDDDSYCINRQCEAKSPAGEACTMNSQCSDGFCGPNGRCCFDTGGECCTDAGQCTASKYTESVCSDPDACMGVSTVPVCRAKLCVAESSTSMGAAACNGQAHNCGAYADRTCPQVCNTSCGRDTDCKDAYYCDTADHACKTGCRINPDNCSGGRICVNHTCETMTPPMAGAAAPPVQSN